MFPPGFTSHPSQRPVMRTCCYGLLAAALGMMAVFSLQGAEAPSKTVPPGIPPAADHKVDFHKEVADSGE